MTLTMKSSVCGVRGSENSEKPVKAASEMAAGQEILLIFV
jgi:hypothetical protein